MGGLAPDGVFAPYKRIQTNGGEHHGHGDPEATVRQRGGRRLDLICCCRLRWHVIACSSLFQEFVPNCSTWAMMTVNEPVVQRASCPAWALSCTVPPAFARVSFRDGQDGVSSRHVSGLCVGVRYSGALKDPDMLYGTYLNKCCGADYVAASTIPIAVRGCNSRVRFEAGGVFQREASNHIGNVCGLSCRATMR